MSANLQRVAEVGAEGRVYVAIGLVIMFVILCGVAFLVGREERKRGDR